MEFLLMLPFSIHYTKISVKSTIQETGQESLFPGQGKHSTKREFRRPLLLKITLPVL